MIPKNAHSFEPPRDEYEAKVRVMLGRVFPRGSRRIIAEALSLKVGRKITLKRLNNLIAPGKDNPRMSLSTAKALVEVLSAIAGADVVSLRRFLNDEEDLDLIHLGENMRANQKLFERVAQRRVKGPPKKG